MPALSMGRFAEPALWVLVALGRGPTSITDLYQAVRSLDGPIGPARMVGALARLEHRVLIERTTGAGRPMYRLANYQPSEASR